MSEYILLCIAFMITIDISAEGLLQIIFAWQDS